MAKNMHGFSAEQMVKMMVMKKLRGDGAIPDVDGLDDIDIPPEHDELLGGLAKLFKTADKNYLTLAELREFEILLEKKGIVDKGGLLKKGGILEDVSLIRKADLTEEQMKAAKNFSLEDHLRPAIDKLTEETKARKKAIAVGKLAKVKEKELEVVTKKKEKTKKVCSDGVKDKGGVAMEKGDVGDVVKEKDGSGDAGGVALVSSEEEVLKTEQKKPADDSLGTSVDREDHADKESGVKATQGSTKTTEEGDRKKDKDGSSKKLKETGGKDKPLQKASVEEVRKKVGKDEVSTKEDTVKKASKESVGKKGSSEPRSKYAREVEKPETVKKETIDHRKMSKESVIAMERYFQERRKKVMQASVEENKRQQALDPHTLKSDGLKYREILARVGEARKAVGIKKSLTRIVRDVYQNETARCPPAAPEIIEDASTTLTSFRHLLYSLEEVTERPGPDGPGAPVVRYKLALNCLARGVKETQMLEMWEVPKTGKTIKDRIQRQCMIPISFQHDLSFAGTHIEDTTNIATIGLKPGGKLELSYLGDGELEDVRVSIKWYEYILKFGKENHSSIFTGMPSEYIMVCYQGVNEAVSEKLAQELLVPWESDTKYANRVYFFQQNGLDAVLGVYEILIRENWRTMTLHLKLMEPGCIQVLAALGSSVLYRQKIIAGDGHGFVLQSFLRVLVRPRGGALVDTSGSPGPTQNNKFMLKELLDAAVQFFVNFRESTEVHQDICSKTNAVDQVISIAHCPAFSVKQAQGCLCLLACCMHSPDMHKWLCRNHTLEGIADCVKTHLERGVASTEDLMLLHYYAQVTLAHLVMTSVHVMARKVTEKLVIFMDAFFQTTNAKVVHELEKTRHPHAGWTPFFPYLKVLLSPMKSRPDVKSRVNEVESVTISQLLDLSMETMLFVIHVMAIASPYKARCQLLEEKTLPYALCLPANVPRRLVSSARAVVSELRKDSAKPVPIPKLNVMARAKLGAIHFGLKKVMDRTADELKLEVSPPPPRPNTVSRVNSMRNENSPLFCIISM